MTLTSNQRNWVVFGGASGVTWGAAMLYLGDVGSNDEAIRLTLRLSAQAAFVVFLFAFVARPLRQIVNTPLTRALLSNRRLIGIAFAGIHTAHLGLIIYRSRQVPDFSFNVTENALGGLTYLLIYAMFLTSFDATARALGQKNWRLLHKVGLYWIFIVFVATQLPQSLDHLAEANWFLLVLTAVAIVIRLTVYLAKRRT